MVLNEAQNLALAKFIVVEIGEILADLVLDRFLQLTDLKRVIVHSFGFYQCKLPLPPLTRCVWNIQIVKCRGWPCTIARLAWRIFTLQIQPLEQI
jgi:hypothetical protein